MYIIRKNGLPQTSMYQAVSDIGRNIEKSDIAVSRMEGVSKRAPGAAQSTASNNTLTPAEEQRADDIALWKAAVEEGGGIWVGVLEGIEGVTAGLALFNSPATGSTLALKPTEPITPEAVREHIAESNEKFGIRREA